MTADRFIGRGNLDGQVLDQDTAIERARYNFESLLGGGPR